MKAIRRYKTYDKRTLVIYDKKTPVAYIKPYKGWFSIDSTKHLQDFINDINIHKMIREYVMKNLYWLLGRDCYKEEWDNSIYCWDIGGRLWGDPVDGGSSLFFEGEKEIALKSFYK